MVISTEASASIRRAKEEKTSWRRDVGTVKGSRPGRVGDTGTEEALQFPLQRALHLADPRRRRRARRRCRRYGSLVTRNGRRGPLTRRHPHHPRMPDNPGRPGSSTVDVPRDVGPIGPSKGPSYLRWRRSRLGPSPYSALDPGPSFEPSLQKRPSSFRRKHRGRISHPRRRSEPAARLPVTSPSAGHGKVSPGKSGALLYRLSSGLRVHVTEAVIKDPLDVTEHLLELILDTAEARYVHWAPPFIKVEPPLPTGRPREIHTGTPAGRSVAGRT